MSTYVDTHVALWLYAGDTERLSVRAAAAINREPLSICPIVLLEIQYLHEIGRITVRPGAIAADLKRRIGLSVEDRSMADVTELGLELSWTRDAFDRLIVAQAALDRAALVTRDRLILKHYPKALW